LCVTIHRQQLTQSWWAVLKTKWRAGNCFSCAI